MKRIGIYPGTFDPITLGHMDIIRRSLNLVDELVIGVTTNAAKSPMFADADRITMVEREITALDAAMASKISVVGFNALLMHFAKAQSASIIVRGLRAVSDFEYEYQMAGMNQQIDASVETVFLMADVSLQPIASRLVKEIALYGGDVSAFVSPAVKVDLDARVAILGRKDS